MNIKYTARFKKHFKKRIQPNLALVERFNERVLLFRQSPRAPLLWDHALGGLKKDFRSFSITGDIRVVYFAKGDDVFFIDIGTHNQIY